MEQKVLGREVRFTLTGCDVERINDLSVVATLVIDMCAELNVEIRRLHEEMFEPQGVSVVAILAESHAAIHTWPELGAATVDIFSCGQVDPVSALPLVARTLRATGSDVTFSERELDLISSEQRYPRFENYILRSTPGGHFAPPTFRRGVGRQFMMEPEGLAWQDFFCSTNYSPPPGQDILLLHPCTWAKPYDFSEFIAYLRAVTDGHPRVHRAIISNVGVVPYEFQMNPYFCSYDYSAAGPSPAASEKNDRKLFTRLAAERISRYLAARVGDYRAVVLLGHPLVSSLRTHVQPIARELGLLGFAVPNAEVYRVAQTQSQGNADVDAPLFMPAVLAQLESKLATLTVHLDRTAGTPSG